MRLMIVGHLEGHISAAGKIALQKGAKVLHCEDVDQAIGALRNGKGADLVMVDLKQNIAQFIQDLKKERIFLPVVACGIGTDARAAVKAIEQGAKEYVPLPPDADLIAAILEAVTQESNAMIANDVAMQQIVTLANRIAPSDATILITGESGTGKEVMARYVHRKSRRANGPFIAVNCAAIPEALLESELFGHEKGAFTGAVARRLGKFEEANGGTLLLDEISEMHPLLQAKLLRALQEREITRIGSNDPVKVDVRILATSNRNMEESIQKGEFREDLYFRLNVVNIKLPALRERKGDLAALSQLFVDKFSQQNNLEPKKLSAAAIEKIRAHHWKGNIRELENTLHRAVLMSMEDELEAEAIYIPELEHLRAAAPSSPAASEPKPRSALGDSPLKQAEGGALQNGQSTELGNAAESAAESLVGRKLADVERDLILGTLDHCLGNRTHAANILGISIRTLRNKLSQYRGEGIDVVES